MKKKSFVIILLFLSFNNISAQIDLSDLREKDATKLFFSENAGIVFQADSSIESILNEKEVAFFNENWPIFGSYTLPFYRLLLKSPFREELEGKLGKRLFQLGQFYIEEDNEQTKALDQKLNKLGSEYNKLTSQGTLTFRGKEYPLQGLGSYMQDTDRATRKEATNAYYTFWNAQINKVDTLFDEMLQLRYKRAKVLGFNNFVEESYNAADYTGEDVSEFNRLVLKYFLPIKKDLHNRRLKRLDMEATSYSYYDTLKFKNGNPRPQVSFEEMMANMQKM